MGDDVTKFHFTGTLSCISNSGSSIPFVVWRLGVWEEDGLIDDHLGDTFLFFLSEAGAFYKIDVQDDGDGPNENFYRIYYKIEHNCTYSGKVKDSKVFVTIFWNFPGDTFYKKDINLLTTHE